MKYRPGSTVSTNPGCRDRPSRSELVERYAAGAGFDVSDLPWYEAFALWKLAVVLQQLFRRFETGQSEDQRYARFADAIPQLLEETRIVLAD